MPACVEPSQRSRTSAGRHYRRTAPLRCGVARTIVDVRQAGARSCVAYRRCGPLSAARCRGVRAAGVARFAGGRRTGRGFGHAPSRSIFLGGRFRSVRAMHCARARRRSSACLARVERSPPAVFHSMRAKRNGAMKSKRNPDRFLVFRCARGIPVDSIDRRRTGMRWPRGSARAVMRSGIRRGRLARKMPRRSAFFEVFFSWADRFHDMRWRPLLKKFVYR